MADRSACAIAVGGPAFEGARGMTDPPVPRAPDAHEVAELRIREAQIRLILEGVRDHAISLLDADGRFVTWNAAAEEITGYKLEEVRGRHARLLATEDDRRAGVPEHQIEVARKSGRFLGEAVRRRKDGTI